MQLSERQQRVISYVAAGYSNRDIAKELEVSEQVVKNIIHSLFDRVGVWNRVELANYFANGENTGQACERIEADRLGELHRRKILDTAADRVFDQLASLAANIFQVPIALVTFVDSDRVWFKSNVGITAAEVPREITICNHTIRQSKVLVVNDALKDERFLCSPLITGEPHVRFYAAAPILTEEGYALGVVCIVDREPRTFSPSQLEVLQSLARIALEQLDLRMKLAVVPGTSERA